MFKGKILLITGGTGSFGNAVLRRFLHTDINEIRIFSRDEKKQEDMRISLNNEKVKYYLGDVRDYNSIVNAITGVDYVFHAAALKQVPSSEFYPIEAVKTNVLGTENLLNAAIAHGVSRVITLSTDKAVYPINAMGISKAMLEKLMLAKARISTSKTVFCGVRYGNVMYSRGSVFPLFVEQIKANKPITITNGEMTRFLLPLPIAIDLVLFALEEGQNGDILVRKSPASTVEDMAKATLKIFNSKAEIKEIGIREGEKMHETLVTQEDLMKAESYDNYYRIRNLEKIDFEKYFSEGTINHFPKEGYTSANTQRLSLEETVNLVLSLKEIQAELNA